MIYCDSYLSLNHTVQHHTALHNPWVMGSCHDVWPIGHGEKVIKEALCTAVQTPEPPPNHLILTPYFYRLSSLLMHSTSYYIKDEHLFLEKFWGHRIAIYIKLAKELSNLQ